VGLVLDPSNFGMKDQAIICNESQGKISDQIILKLSKADTQVHASFVGKCLLSTCVTLSCSKMFSLAIFALVRPLTLRKTIFASV